MTDFFKDAEDHINIDPAKDPFDSLTGPGGKYDRSKYDSEADMFKAMAKGKVEADAYIDHMKRVQDELRSDYTSLREQYNAGPKLQQLIDQLAERGVHQDSNTPPANDDKAVLDLNKVEELFNSKLTQFEQNKKEEANARRIEAKLIEKFGNSYQSSLKSQIDSLGLDKDLFNGLARQHPELLIKTLGLDSTTNNNFQAPPHSSQGSPVTPQGTKRTNSYYQKMRKEQPEVYRSPKIQDQMFKDAVVLGEAFKDGDWNAYGHKY